MASEISTDLMYRLLVQGVRDHAIYMLDKDGVVLNWNAGAERAKGYAASEIVGRNYECFYSPEDRAAGVPRHNLALAFRDGHLIAEGWRYRKDGTAFWASVVIEVIRDEGGKFIGFAKVTRDLTEKRDAELMAEHMARHDSLTGILNRQGFTERLGRSLDEAKGSAATAVFYVDLDRFKPINDTFGHPVGDEVLREAAGRIQRVVEGRGALGRLGGDEFGVYVQNATDGAVTAAAQRIVDDLARPMYVGGLVLNIGGSVGVSVAPDHGTEIAALLRNADLALYRAKYDGRKCFRIYDDGMGAAALARSNLEYRLRKAADAEEFRLFYQPIVDGRDGRTLGYEALIRWTDEAGATVCPTAFVPLAESIGVMPSVEEWTLRQACQAAVTWPGDVYVSVNLSTTQLKQPLVDLVIRTLSETNLPARRLMLEITETSALEDLGAAKLALSRLRGVGVRIALDDFGTGYSSLSLVKELPLTCIKIDRSFISAGNSPAHADTFVKSIVTLCAGYDLTAIAEGVETEAQRALLLACGCRTMQGYLFGRPARLSELPENDKTAREAVMTSPKRSLAREDCLQSDFIRQHLSRL